MTVWPIWHTVSYPLSHTSHSKYGGWRHFVFIVSDGLQQTLGRVVQSHLHVTVPLSVSCPQHYHLHNRNTLYHTLVKEGSPPSFSISCKGLKVYSNKWWPPLALFSGSPLAWQKIFVTARESLGMRLDHIWASFIWLMECSRQRLTVHIILAASSHYTSCQLSWIEQYTYMKEHPAFGSNSCI